MSNKQKRGRMSKEEVQYIIDNAGKSSVEEIAVHLNRKVETVSRFVPETQSVSEPSPVNSQINRSKGVTQMTKEASERADAAVYSTQYEREGLTTMTGEKARGGV